VKPLERERRPCTVADETLDPRTVLGLDTHGGVDDEAARALPGEHAYGVGLVEEVAAKEVAEDASLKSRLHLADVIGRQSDAS
jgi:hypothetical protein